MSLGWETSPPAERRTLVVMSRVVSHRIPRNLAVLLAVACAVSLVAVTALWRPWVGEAPTSRADAGSAGSAGVVAGLELPENPRVLVFGDSWTYGSAATSPDEGYAYVLADLLGGETIVDGVRGSGYLKTGLDGGTFVERAQELDPALSPDLVIVQGSINDRKLGSAGYADAVATVWDTIASIYPNAAIVILGPAPQVLPVERATARIDNDLAQLAAERGWPYISPVQEAWITPANYSWVIDTSATGRDHPTSAGHAYLAERVAEALATFRVDAPAQ